MNLQMNPISESEALRTLNLPSTESYRNFLRSKLPHATAGKSRIYNSEDVDQLSAKIGDFAAETARHAEVQTRTAAPATRTNGGLTDRRGPSA